MLSLVFATLLLSASTGDDGSTSALPLAVPRYEFKLGPEEAALFRDLLGEAASKLGAEIEFEQKLRKEGEGLVSTITIRNPGIFESVHYWAAERAAQLVASIDLDHLGSDNGRLLRTAGSLYRSLAKARRNPLYDTQSVAGRIEMQGEAAILQSPRGRFLLTGSKIQTLRAFAGSSVRAFGLQKEQGRFEVERLVEQKENTLEVFVMSRCPIARQSLAQLIRHLRGLPKTAEPTRLEVRYLFYLAGENGGRRQFTSMHGEEEVAENLLQIVLRENFPQAFPDYLLLREHSDAPWKELAGQLGLRSEDLQRIETRMIADRDALIEAEYEHVSGAHRIFDGSPTYLWEGAPVGDLRGVEPFRQIELLASSCSTSK